MVSLFPPQGFSADSNATLHELGEFLYETNRNIERILHSYTLKNPPVKNAIFSDVSKGGNSPFHSSSPAAAPPTVTRSLLPNIGLTMLENRSNTLDKEDMAQEGNCRDGSSVLRIFMEEIVKTSSDWCAKHKVILGEKGTSFTVDSTKPKEPCNMRLNENKNTEIGSIPEDEIEGSAKVHLNTSSSLSSVNEANKCIRNPLILVAKGEEKSETKLYPEDIGRISHNPCGKDGDYVVNLTMGYEQAQQNGDANNADGDGDKDGDSNVSQHPMDSYATPLPTRYHEDKTRNVSLVSHDSTTDMSIQPYRRPVEVIDSPDWLPEGWITELRIRGTGNSAGSKDKYYIDPDTKRRFRSRKDVLDFIETGKLNRQRKKPGTSPIRRFSEGSSLIPTKQPIKRAKSREDTMTHSSMPPITSSLAINNTNHNSSNGAIGNNMFPPFRTPQPTSEWLMYESLASLPFPVYDAFRYADANITANKPGINKVQQGPSSAATRPWFFTGPDASWMPFSNIGKAGNNRVPETQNAYAMPPPPPPPSYSAEFAQKKRIRKTKKNLA